MPSALETRVVSRGVPSEAVSSPLSSAKTSSASASRVDPRSILGLRLQEFRAVVQPRTLDPRSEERSRIEPLPRGLPPPRSRRRGWILDGSSDRGSEILGPSWIRDRKISDPRSEDLGSSTLGSIEDRGSSSRFSSSSSPSSRLDPRWILGSRIQNPRAVVDSRSPKISDPRSEDLGSSTLGSIEEST